MNILQTFKPWLFRLNIQNIKVHYKYVGNEMICTQSEIQTDILGETTIQLNMLAFKSTFVLAPEMLVCQILLVKVIIPK